MMKRALVFLAALLLPVCALAQTEQTGNVVLTFNGEPVYATDVVAAAQTLASYGYIQSETDYRGAIAYLVSNQLTAREKAKELGLDKLSDAELTAVTEEATDAFEEYVASMVETGLTNAGLEDTIPNRAAMHAQAVSYLEENGFTEEKYIESYQENLVLQKLLDSIETSVTDAEITQIFEENVEKDRAQFENDVRSYEYYVYYAGYDIWYRPAGYRAITQILLKPDQEALDAYLDLSDDAAAAEVQAAYDRVIESRQGDIDAIYAHLADGEDFSALIAEYGADQNMTDSALSEGYLVHPESVVWNDGVIDAAFDEQMQTPGDYSSPKVDKSGIHIAYYLKDVPEGGVELTDAIRDAIRSHLQSLKQKTQLAAWAQEYDVVYDEAAITALENEAIAAQQQQEAQEQAEIDAAVQEALQEKEGK